MKAKQTNKNTVVGNFEEPIPRFRTPYTKNIILERCSSKSDDFVDNATPSLSSLIDKFNRGQRLTGVNYGINPNLVPVDMKNADDPDDLYPVRCDDIVDVEVARKDLEARKASLKEKKSKKQQVSEQDPS